jgi:hypothetical protein
LKGTKKGGSWRKLHNEEFHNLYASPNIITVIKLRRMRWAGSVACRGEMKKAYKVLVGKREGKRPLGKHRRRWEDNIRMDLREIVEWIRLIRDKAQWRAVVNTVMNIRFP